MPVTAVLQEDEIIRRLGTESAWIYQDKKLYRRLVFEDFVHAFGFMSQVAIVAEKMDHHPEWANVYRTIDIYLTTHEFSGVSERDFILADKIDALID